MIASRAAPTRRPGVRAAVPTEAEGLSSHPQVSCMSERFIFTRHRTRCYHCGEDADQIIKAVSAQAQVICSACGATRIFIPRFESAGMGGTCTAIGCYELWTLEADGRCKNCGVTGPHGLAVGCGHLTTRCRNCGYTHFYRFNLEYMGKRSVGGADEVSAPPAP